MVLSIQNCLAFPGMQAALTKLSPCARPAAIAALSLLANSQAHVSLIASHTNVRLVQNPNIVGTLYEIDIGYVRFFVFDYKYFGKSRICITAVSVLSNKTETCVAMQ